MLDDGWQKSVGDWVADTAKYPQGDAGLKEFADRIKTYGMRPKLWISPLSASPASDLYREHRDMLLLDADGAAQNVSWWNSYTLCPAYQPTVGLFQSGHSPQSSANGGSRVSRSTARTSTASRPATIRHTTTRGPEESVEKLQDFWKAIYDTAMSVDPNTNIEICPCGDSFAFFNIPA